MDDEKYLDWYGSDFEALDDLRADLGTAIGPKTLLQNAYRRITTSRGWLWYDADYGTNILSFLADGGLSTDQKAGLVRDEILKDERVENCIVQDQGRDQVERFYVEVVGLDNATYPLTLVVDDGNISVIVDGETEPQ